MAFFCIYAKYPNIEVRFGQQTPTLHLKHKSILYNENLLKVWKKISLSALVFFETSSLRLKAI